MVEKWAGVAKWAEKSVAVAKRVAVAKPAEVAKSVAVVARWAAGQVEAFHSRRKLALRSLSVCTSSCSGYRLFLFHQFHRTDVVRSGARMVSIVAHVQKRTVSISNRLRTLPENYHIEYVGQFEAQQQANFRLFVVRPFSFDGDEVGHHTADSNFEDESFFVP